MATIKNEKRELLRFVEEQRIQLERYEKRLGDVVAAYKSLNKEKKALEASLKALSAGQSLPIAAQQSDDVTAPNVNTETAGSSASEDQVTTLTKALSTLTNEKSRMEASFQADKKKLKQEKDELEAQLKKEKHELDRQRSSISSEVSELKKKIWSQQMEREKEHSDHAVMLRELQTLVAIERSGKEQLELQLEEMRQNLDRRPDFQQMCIDYQNKIQELSDKLEHVKVRLKESEERAVQPQPLLLKLQSELESLKDQHHSSIFQERCRANDAEDQLQQIAEIGEERVANLELKLSGLSDTVGNYDRIRQQDQQAINTLKERVAQLERENSLLSGAASFGIREARLSNEESDDDTNLDIQTLMGRIVKLKGLLFAANHRSEKPVNIKEFMNREGLVAEADHTVCKEELIQLKEEFERYKMRAQSVLKNKSHKESSFSKEEESLKRQVNELKNKLKVTLDENEEKEEHYKKLVEESNSLLSRTRQKHMDDMSKCQTENRAKISDLENEMQKHRHRTIQLLEEKDNEIKRLKVSLGIAMYKPRDSEDGEFSDVEPKDQEEIRENVQQLVMLGPSDAQILHYVQEISRKDLEIAALRRSKHQLETALRELQTNIVAKEEKYADEIEILNNKIHRLERNVSREGANLEYLKNVVLSYMLSSDASSRHHIINAIATLLKFSPKELSSVQKYNKAWWWQHPPKPSDKL